MDSSRVKSVLVVGAGVMGHSIAQVFAQADIEVRLVDVKTEILERAMDRIRSNLGTLAEFGRVRKDRIDTILGRIQPSTELPATGKEIDFAIEAVVEVPEVKRALFSRLEALCGEDTVLASNTSSLDIFSIAQVKRPERLVVAHWFAPPHIIPLVEVVPGPKTRPDVVAFTAALMQRIGKRPMVMKTFVPSFIVNRVQNAISRIVWEMLENRWASPEEIDLAVKLVLGVRLPIVGVVQTSDFTGLDLVYDIMNAQGRLNPLVEEKVRQGHLGAKTSRGIYDYKGRTENEILKKRDERYLKTLEHLERIGAFEPI
jgi:3-hydroxybutyryl-CoA dehydrogenase